MSRLTTAPALLVGAAAGAAAVYFLDPENGRRRRSQLRDQGAARAREAASGAASKASYAAGKAQGAAASVTPKPPGSRPVSDLDDVGLARKVETEIFRPADAPKGQVSVNAQDGVVYLRGEVPDQSWIDRFASDAAKVEGVKRVESLLHRPGETAPTGAPTDT
jgi:osmotically-inducible protein OsmY